MSEVKHTPGPWKVLKSDGYGAIVGNDKGDVVTPAGPSIEDARLIAAAPEMLEALKSTSHLLMAAAFVITHDESRAHAIKTAEAAKAVIARADHG